MDRRVRRMSIGLGLAAVLGLLPGSARAQFPAVSTGVASNPYATPTGAPFMNTMAAMAMSQQSVDPGTAALYFLSTSQPGSMLGMGRINQNRLTGGASQGGGRPANDPSRGTANVPGALASRYFNRTMPTALKTDHFYKRQPRQYPSHSQSQSQTR